MKYEFTCSTDDRLFVGANGEIFNSTISPAISKNEAETFRDAGIGNLAIDFKMTVMDGSFQIEAIFDNDNESGQRKVLSRISLDNRDATNLVAWLRFFLEK